MKRALILTYALQFAATVDDGNSQPVPEEVRRIESHQADRAGETTEHLATEEEAKKKLDEVSPEHIAAPHADVGEVTTLESESKTHKTEKKEEKKAYNGQNHMGTEYIPPESNAHQ